MKYDEHEQNSLGRWSKVKRKGKDTQWEGRKAVGGKREEETAVAGQIGYAARVCAGVWSCFGMLLTHHLAFDLPSEFQQYSENLITAQNTQC